jgi:hypothetical protein
LIEYYYFYIRNAAFLKGKNNITTRKTWATSYLGVFGKMRRTRKILAFLKKQDKPLTKTHLEHILNIPPLTLHAEIDTLRNSGEIQEATLEQLLRDGK